MLAAVAAVAAAAAAAVAAAAAARAAIIDAIATCALRPCLRGNPDQSATL